MRRLAGYLIGPLLLASTALTAGPAAAASARPAVGINRIAGDYTVYAKFDKKGYQPFALHLYKNGTGTDHFGDYIKWTVDDHDVEMNFDDGLWQYSGMKTKAGMNNLKHPGTATNINGGSGTWYAVKLNS